MNRAHLSASEVSWREEFTVLNGREGVGLHPLAVTSRKVVDKEEFVRSVHAINCHTVKPTVPVSLKKIFRHPQSLR